MNLRELEQKLIAAARANPPSDQVPYAFEKRMMALLPARPLSEDRELWARALWRAAATCLLFAVLLGTFYLLARPITPAGDLTQDFEKTMLAAVDQEGDSF